MNFNYPKVIAWCLLPFLGIDILSAQPNGPQFLNCSSTPESLCIQDEGVRLPANNQVYLGVENPGATSCSVHVTQKKFVQFNFCGPFQYEVQLFIEDTSAALILKSPTSITTDSTGMAELYFNTEESPDAQISGAGIPYTKGCAKYHRIKWIVTDTCGEESVCEQLIDLYDCSKPLVSNDPEKPFIFPIGFSGSVHIYAKDLITGVLDDCVDDQNFLCSLKATEYVPDSLLPCWNIPAYSVELSNKVWIADDGKDLNCDGIIDWQERNIYEQEILIVYKDISGTDCGDPNSPVKIEGYIRDRIGQGIGNVTVTLSTANQVYPPYTTTQSGFYVFNNVEPNRETTITPEKNDRHKNGVSTLDLVQIQKHILGISLFDSPFQTIAADANNSQYLSAIDLIQLRKLILGIDTELPNNKSWRFVREDYEFQDAEHPWPIYEFENIVTEANYPVSNNFIALKVGDVNFSYQPYFTDVKPRAGLLPFDLVTDYMEYKNGEIIQVPIKISSSQTLTGFQFTLNTMGMEIQDVLPGHIPITEGEYALFGDKMTMSWFDENNVDVSADDVLFTLVLKANQAGSISQALSINSEITDAEIYLDGDQTFLPVLKMSNTIDENELAIQSCTPNPWEDETSVLFFLPESGNVTYHIMDVNGKEVFSDSEFLSEGYHSYVLNSKDFEERGMLFLEISAGRSREVQKMLILK